MLGHCCRDTGNFEKALQYFSQLSDAQNGLPTLFESVFYQLVCLHEMDMDFQKPLIVFISLLERIDEVTDQSQGNEKQSLAELLKHALVFFNLLDKPVEIISISKSLLKLYMGMEASNCTTKGIQS